MCSFDFMRVEFIETVKHCYEHKNIETLQKKYDSLKASEMDKRVSLDLVMREYLLDLLAEPSNNILCYELFVTFCIQACRKDMCTPTMPVVLLGDIFDAMTLDQCQHLFAFVENGVNVWKEDLFFSACKNNLLRMCNDLLRRLSRSQNTVFCGRILLFLAKFFPVSERSGLNIVSEFNLDNVTEFGGEGATADLKDLPVEHDDPSEEEAQADSKFKIDYNLYCKFWALQDFFRNPNQCYNEAHWKSFSAHASNVLLAFKSFKLEDVQGKGNRNRKLTPHQQAHQHYFAKFLTNQKLLELQLNDSNFRRYVLVQFLIVFQYLNSQVKFKLESQELKPEQIEWVKETTDMVYQLLAETPPDGPTFVKSVKHILKREEYWSAWKNDGCPEFRRPNHMQDDSDDEDGERSKVPPRPRRPKKRLGDMMKEAAAQNKFNMGNPELNKLWNLCPDNLEACKSDERDFLPTLEGYFEEALEQMDPSSMVEEEYKRVNDGDFGWRALRLLASRSPHFFTHSNNPINKLPEYLETMIKKIAKDKPSLLSNEEIKIEVFEPEMQTTKEDEEEDELLKSEERDEHAVHEYEEETASAPEKTSQLTSEQISSIANLVADNWQKLATKVGYQPDEVEYFQTEHSTDIERAQVMLKLWADDDEDATPANLAYILEGLGFSGAAELLKE